MKSYLPTISILPVPTQEGIHYLLNSSTTMNRGRCGGWGSHFKRMLNDMRNFYTSNKKWLKTAILAKLQKYKIKTQKSIIFQHITNK